MKRTILALTLTVGLLSSFAVGMQTLEVAKANFLPAPAIQINSPWPSFLKIYQNNTITLAVGVRVLTGDPDIIYIRYSLDGKANVTLTSLSKTDLVSFAPNRVGFAFWTSSVLDNLAEGNHTLKVYSHDAAGKEMSSSREFTVDTHYKYPEILILSPQNQTYTTTELPLNFIVDRHFIFAHYSLDSRGNVSITTNTTLTGLSVGAHKILVTAWTGREFASQTTYFSIDNPTAAQTPMAPNTDYFSLLKNPIFYIIIIVVIMVPAVSIGMLVYFKKRKR